MANISEFVDNLADNRSRLHEGKPSSRELSEDYQKIGLSGEFAFGAFSGLMPDISERPNGDNGIDFKIKLGFSVDVKTFNKPNNLICEVGKVVADIYILAKRNPDLPTGAELLGWEFGKKLKNAPTKDFGFGITNHFIDAKELRSMDELKKRMIGNDI
jgi:hypothetical protein